MIRKYYVGFVLLLLLLLPYTHAGFVGNATIHAPAVLLSNNTGSLTTISLVITNGTGNVVISGPAIVGQSTVQSAQTAAMYAANYTNHDFSHYNFNYTISNAGNNVSGPSAGAAMTILAVSAFTGKKLRSDFTMTGTISSNGSIGEIGGVYDKVSAAKEAGLKLVLVPKVAPTNQEDELYLLVQTNFGIPLVQVANISQATTFVFNPNVTGISNETYYSFYRSYDVNAIPAANLTCTGFCNSTIFAELLNATFNLTKNSINTLNSNPKYANVSAQFGGILNQSIQIAHKGYDYTAADIAFLDYVNVYYFNGYSTNRASALNLLDNVQSFCGSLSAPQLTTNNYDYVINAELRQAWGNYTINATVSSYNSSQIDSDEILDELYLGAQANGWCTAANLVYNEASQSSGANVIPSNALKSIALDRLNRASLFGESLYLETAQQAYKANNYPVAILDADYAYSLENPAAINVSTSTGQLQNQSLAIAQNSTYSVWATEFAKESNFYVYESRLSSSNATLSKSYAQEAYVSAVLAQQISNDTKLISANLVPGTGLPQPISVGTPSTQKQLQDTQVIILVLIAIIIVLLVSNGILAAMLISRRNRNKAKPRRSRSRK